MRLRPRAQGRSLRNRPFGCALSQRTVGAKFHSFGKTARFLGNVAEKPTFRTREASDHAASCAGLRGPAGICHCFRRGGASQPRTLCRSGFHAVHVLSRHPWVLRAQALPFARTPVRSEIAKRRRVGGEHRPSTGDESNWSNAARRSGAAQAAGGTELRPVGERKRFWGAHRAATSSERRGPSAQVDPDRARGGRNPVLVPGESRRAMSRLTSPDRGPGRSAGLRLRLDR